MRYRWALAAIVLTSMALTAVWVARVPIYQAPDEPLNLDYALALRAHRGLFRVPGSHDDLPRTVHPYSDYLLRVTAADEIAFRWWRKVTPDYGTWEYFREVERHAPDVAGLVIDEPNRPYAVYPFGYYGLLAIWLAGVSQVSDGPVFLFFAARALSVLLLGLSLLLVYGTLRRLAFRPPFALLLTACVGLFPLTAFVASAVQMDNLSFFLVSLAYYLALGARRQPGNLRAAAWLGLALGGLLVTKVHFFLCVFVPIALMLGVEMHAAGLLWKRRLLLGGLLVTPALLGGAVYAWSAWETTNLFAAPAPSKDGPVLHTLRWFEKAYLDFYGGLTHESFWGKFGWIDAPLTIWGQKTTQCIRWVLQVVAWGLLALTLLRLEQVTTRLVRLARRGRALLAVRLALSNPLLNSYFLFTVLMFGLYIHTENRFGGQGRQWWPLLLPIFLTGIVYAPRALTLRPTRRAVTAVLLAGLCCYCVFGSVYALRTIERRYYPNEREVVEVGSLPQAESAAVPSGD